MQHLRNRLEQTQARIDAHEEEHGTKLGNENEQRLKQLEKIFKPILIEKKKKANLQKTQKEKDKGQAKVDELSAAVRERDAGEARINITKSLNEQKEEEATLKRQIEEDRGVIEDENTLLGC